MMRRVNVFLMILVIIVFVCQVTYLNAKNSDINDDCVTCIENQNVWCALTRKCVLSVSDCHYRYNVTWFKIESKKARIQDIPAHCMTGIFIAVEQCPTSICMLCVDCGK
jgi:hypothetical protein